MPKSKKGIGVIYGTYGQWGQEFVEEWHKKMSLTELPIRFFAQKLLKKGSEIQRINPEGKFLALKEILSGNLHLSIKYNKSFKKQLKEELALLHFHNAHLALKLWKDIPADVELIFTFRGYDINVRPDKDKDWSNFLKEIFQRAKYLHFVSDTLKSKAIEMGAKPEKCVTIHRSVDLKQFRINEKIVKGDISTINILSVGRIAWEKGHIYALEALAKIKNEAPEFTWTIIGKGPDLQHAEINFHIQRLELQNIVKLLGYLPKDHIQEEYQKADIFLQPSLSEGLPNTILEASAMSLPVIASKAGGIPEAVVNGETGFLHEVADIKSMANDLKKLLMDPDLRKAMGEKGRSRMEEEFNPNLETEQWIDLYKKSIKL